MIAGQAKRAAKPPTTTNRTPNLRLLRFFLPLLSIPCKRAAFTKASVTLLPFPLILKTTVAQESCWVLSLVPETEYTKSVLLGFFSMSHNFELNSVFAEKQVPTDIAAPPNMSSLALFS